MKATHKEYDQMVGYQKVHLMPGDFIFGRLKASEELELSERSIRTCLDFLSKSQNVTIKTTNKFSIISIVNWGIYQSEDIQNDHQNDQPPTSHRPATDHKQECKEHKNVKNKKIYGDDFLTFYGAYPKKVGKKPAWRAWQKRTDLPPLDEIISAIEKQKTTQKWGNGFIPDPATWINQDRWTDDIQSMNGGNSGQTTTRFNTPEKDFRSTRQKELDAETDKLAREYYAEKGIAPT